MLRRAEADIDVVAVEGLRGGGQLVGRKPLIARRAAHTGPPASLYVQETRATRGTQRKQISESRGGEKDEDQRHFLEDSGVLLACDPREDDGSNHSRRS